MPPTGLAVTRADASWDPVAGATVQQVQYKDANGTTILEVSTFDNSAAVVIPSLVALPATGTLSARVSGIGATLNVHDFSLENDKDQLFGIAEQPATVP